MKTVLDQFKKIILVLIPISLIFSIYVNSIIVIVFLILYVPNLLKNFENYNNSRNRKAFLVLSSFIGVYLVGFIIDAYYGIVNLKKAETLLPFIIFPLIFLFTSAGDQFKDKTKPLHIFATFIVLFNFFLITNLLVQSWAQYNDNSFNNKRWLKKNISIKETSENFDSNLFEVFEISGNSNYNKQEIIQNQFFSIDRETFVTRSIYIKAKEDIWLLIRQYDGINHKGAWFNPKNLKVGYVQNGVNAQIDSLNNGWARLSLTNKLKNYNKRERFQITFVDGDKRYNNNNIKDFRILVGGAQLEFSNKATEYRPLDHKQFWDSFDRSQILEVINGHPTYYSMYIVFSTVILFFIAGFGIKQMLFTLINIITLVLLGSKAGILTFCLILLTLPFVKVNSFNLKKKVFAFVALIFVLIALLFSKTFNRFEQSINTLTNDASAEFLSTDKRIFMWEAILQLPVCNLILGNGNIHGYELIRSTPSLSLNSHNQYLEAILVSGFIGILFLLIFLFGLFFIDSSSRKNKFLILFIIIVGINLCFENMLNRQWGIVFIAYFLPYLYILPRNSK